MRSGVILLYDIPRVVMEENRTFTSEKELLKSRGVDIILLNNEEHYKLLQEFITKHPKLWFEDTSKKTN